MLLLSLNNVYFALAIINIEMKTYWPVFLCISYENNYIEGLQMRNPNMLFDIISPLKRTGRFSVYNVKKIQCRNVNIWLL